MSAKAGRISENVRQCLIGAACACEWVTTGADPAIGIIVASIGVVVASIRIVVPAIGIVVATIGVVVPPVGIIVPAFGLPGLGELS